MTDWQSLLLALVIGYALGSIPFGLILTRITGGGDLRTIGSGNIGATNVLRTGRKGIAAATLLLDLGKGALAVFIAREIGPQFAMAGAFGAFLGHCWPVWLRFKGGKGVATMLGVSLALAWQVGLVFALVWLGALAVTRISSVGGMTAAVAAPVAAFAFGLPAIAIGLGGLAILVLWNHRENIARLLAGTEPRVGSKSA